MHSADLSNRLRIPEVTFPGPSSYAFPKSFDKMDSIVFSHKTGDVTCVAKSFLIVAGSEWGLASTLLMTGIRGFLISTPSRTFSKDATAGDINSANQKAG